MARGKMGREWGGGKAVGIEENCTSIAWRFHGGWNGKDFNVQAIGQCAISVEFVTLKPGI